MISAISHLSRLARAGFVFAREGVFALVDPTPMPWPAQTALKLARLLERPTSISTEGRLAAALTKLGPTYVKLGQFLATRPDVVGVALARDLESLQDKMAPFPQAEAEAVVAAGLGKPLKAAYASFGPSVAAASIAQVHRAEVATPEGKKAVAAKVGVGLGVVRHRDGSAARGRRSISMATERRSVLTVSIMRSRRASGDRPSA